MELAGLNLYRYDLPLVEPIKLKDVTLRSREGLLIRLTDVEGEEGWGEAAALPGFSRETLEDASRQLLGAKSSLLGAEIPAGHILPLSPSSRLANLVPSARFALELAAWNMISSPTGGTPTLTKDPPKETVLINGLLAGSTEKVLTDALHMRKVGYSAVRIKVGRRGVPDDVGLIRDVRDVLGDGVGLRVDANRAWSFEEALEFGKGVADSGVEYVEEPLSAPGRLAELARSWGLPLALDEALVGMEPEELERHGYARAVVLKPTFLGGISRTLALAGRALGLGMKPTLSSSYESGVGTAALVATAAAVGDQPAGLDTYRWLAGDVILNPLKLPAPSIDVRRATQAAGEVDLGRLEPVREPR